MRGSQIQQLLHHHKAHAAQGRGLCHFLIPLDFGNTLCDTFKIRGTGMDIFKSAWFTRFARKEKISVVALCDAVDRAERGLIDADLGAGVIKQRIARTGEGRSKGYRTILLFRKQHRCFFVYGFAKSELENISAIEEAQFKKMARHVLDLTDAQLRELVTQGHFEKVVPDA
jgi:hypothetical protein